MTNKSLRYLALGFGVMALMTMLPSVTFAAPVVFSGAGPTPASIQGQVDAFRTQLGALNPNVVGSFGSGRREINWDGVPNALSSPNNFPPSFFNVNSPRGVIFSTPGTGFQVSANAAIAPVEFDNINPTYSSTFQTFSPQRLFTSVGSNILDVTFFVPGTSTPAFVSGFGSVFTDVDLANVTSLQFFDIDNNSLGTFFAPTANNGMSFLGVFFNGGEQVGRVRIINGNSALGPNDGGPVDVVVMDDFIYGEPNAVQAVPEPTTMLLLSTGLAGIAARGLKRRRVRRKL